MEMEMEDRLAGISSGICHNTVSGFRQPLLFRDVGTGNQQLGQEIRILIARATAARAAGAEKSHAFGEIVRRFQDMAFACAFAVLGDFHLARVDATGDDDANHGWPRGTKPRIADAPAWSSGLTNEYCVLMFA